MAESLAFTKSADRAAIYSEIIPQIESLVATEGDQTANLATIAAVLNEAFGFFWVGFYLKKADQLVLGPFQGPLACTRIDFDKGVCGAAYTERRTVIVPDVEKFPGHIACSSASRSEIVVPVIRDGEVVAVLDADSDKLNHFSEADAEGLEHIARIAAKSF
ncbi:MAG: GAF domain-containing protein [Acidobacteria bacterium]|nr:GAF domain-containing protein [Acidobacteriota bacterium]MCA1608658.1 GAF domain-containing protein [Acidobacteriota bacterium]